MLLLRRWLVWFLLVVLALWVAAKTLRRHPGSEGATPGGAEVAMKEDLRRLVGAQDRFFSMHKRYGSLIDLADDFTPAFSHATITLAADSHRFVATAASPGLSLRCLVWSGDAPPDSARGAPDGVAVCWEP
jgi:hypothetical protein